MSSQRDRSPKRAMCPCSHLVLPGEWADAGLWPAPRGLPRGSAELGSKPSGLQVLLRVPRPDRGSVSPAYPSPSYSALGASSPSVSLSQSLLLSLSLCPCVSVFLCLDVCVYLCVSLFLSLSVCLFPSRTPWVRGSDGPSVGAWLDQLL